MNHNFIHVSIYSLSSLLTTSTNQILRKQTAKLDSLNSSPISTRRLLSGYGQERGKIGIELSNHLSRTAEVIWIETWPWWIRGFISSLKAEVSDISGMRDSG